MGEASKDEGKKFVTIFHNIPDVFIHFVAQKIGQYYFYRGIEKERVKIVIYVRVVGINYLSN